MKRIWKDDIYSRDSSGDTERIFFETECDTVAIGNRVICGCDIYEVDDVTRGQEMDSASARYRISTVLTVEEKLDEAHR